jgi:hypothetical protein
LKEGEFTAVHGVVAPDYFDFDIAVVGTNIKSPKPHRLKLMEKPGRRLVDLVDPNNRPCPVTMKIENQGKITKAKKLMYVPPVFICFFFIWWMDKI